MITSTDERSSRTRRLGAAEWLALGLAILTFLFLLFVMTTGTYSVEAYVDTPRATIAQWASVLLVCGTACACLLILALRRTSVGRVAISVPPRWILLTGAAGWAVAAYMISAAAPGGFGFHGSDGEHLLGAFGLWMGLVALAWLGFRYAWLATAVASAILFGLAAF